MNKTIEQLKQERAKLDAEITQQEQSENSHKLFLAEIKKKAQGRSSRVEAFGAAMAKGKAVDLEQSLKAAGWIRSFTSADKKTTYWGNKSKPGVQIRITGDKFSVYKNGEITVKDQPVEFISAFLNKK